MVLSQGEVMAMFGFQMNVINSEIIDDLSGLLREADEKPWKIFRFILDCKREAFQR